MAQFTDQTLTVPADVRFRLDAIIGTGTITLDGVTITATSIPNGAILQGATLVLPATAIAIGEWA